MGNHAHEPPEYEVVDGVAFGNFFFWGRVGVLIHVAIFEAGQCIPSPLNVPPKKNSIPIVVPKSLTKALPVITMASPDLQEIHDLFVKVAHKADTLILAASSTSSSHAHTHKNNCAFLPFSPSLPISCSPNTELIIASSYSSRSRNAHRQGHRRPRLINPPHCPPHILLPRRRNLQQKTPDRQPNPHHRPNRWNNKFHPQPSECLHISRSHDQEGAGRRSHFQSVFRGAVFCD
jgi:hypothetical protein